MPWRKPIGARIERCKRHTVAGVELVEAYRQAGIDYDEAIYFFNRATAEKRLERKGKAGGTHYVRGASQV